MVNLGLAAIIVSANSFVLSFGKEAVAYEVTLLLTPHASVVVAVYQLSK